jgi:hypothetical protein
VTDLVPVSPPPDLPLEGTIVCGQTASQCVCVKDFGHADQDDPVHACDPADCGGMWTGTHGTDSFHVVQYPGEEYPSGPPIWVNDFAFVMYEYEGGLMTPEALMAMLGLTPPPDPDPKELDPP